MGLSLLFSPSVSFTKMPLIHSERKPPVWASFSVHHPIHCRASNQVSNDSQIEIGRRSANFKPTIWTYDYLQTLRSKYKEKEYQDQISVLREDVRMMFEIPENELSKLELIDELQRLGVAYHFSNEIRKILDNIYKKDAFNKRNNLHATALEFRLLRQHGYHISTDVFHYFQDEMDNFKKGHGVEGMLSLYEASFLSLEGEIILDVARDFTSQFLKEHLTQNRGVDHISLLINHALELPLHWRIPRWEAEWFINAYETKQNMNPTLLGFAKLDFNSLQAVYQDELKYTSRWWKSTGLVESMRFIRDRLVESFIWTVGTSFEPEFGYFRKVMTKINSLITTIDDIYDIYGTMEELELFTEVVDRWDLNAANNLPEYMKICFHALNNFVKDVDLEAKTKDGNDITPYLKNVWRDQCKSYYTEAKWYYNGYAPSLDEYIENAWISISAPVVLVHAYFSIPHSMKKEDYLAYLEEYSDIIRFSAVIARLANDLASFKRENEMGDVAKSIRCYMNESGAAEEEACDHVKSIMCTMWKKMNKEASNSSFSRTFVDTTLNLARMAMCMYQNGDGHTVQDLGIKNRILSLIIQPFLL